MKKEIKEMGLLAAFFAGILFAENIPALCILWGIAGLLYFSLYKECEAKDDV